MHHIQNHCLELQEKLGQHHQADSGAEEGSCRELTPRLALAVGRQWSETQVHVAGEGVAGTEVGGARCRGRAGPGGGASDLTARAAAERDGAVANRPARKHSWRLQCNGVNFC